MFESDDFAAGSGPAWQVTTPSGTAQGIGADAADAFLTLSTSGGTFDLWQGTKTVPRALQAMPDTDFSLEARFLSEPSRAFQMQGFLVEAGPDTWLRFDTFHDGTTLRAFGAVTVAGQTTAVFNTPIAAGAAAYLWLQRTGDTFVLRYSQDGESWTEAGRTTRAVTVTEAGVFAGSVGGGSAFTAQVDYVEAASDPLVDEDGGYSPPNAAPEAADDAFATPEDTALEITEAALLGNDGDANGDPLEVLSVTAPAHGTLTQTASGWLYTPAAGYAGPDSFTYTVGDGTATDTATVDLTVGTPPPPPAFVSDDFVAGPGPGWQVTTPPGTAQGEGTNAADAFLTLSTSGGTFDLWQGTKTVPRALQAMPDADFALEARFLSAPSRAFQMQGFLVEAGPDTWLRFDTFHDGTTLRAFGAITVAGQTTAVFNTPIAAGAAPYLRLERSGDTFVLRYSPDGESWTEAGRTTRAVTVTEAGVFAGSVGAGSAFTAQVDYVEAASDPLVDEDCGYSPPNAAPEAADDAFATPGDTALEITEAALLGNDSDANGDPLEVLSVTAPAHGTLTGTASGWLYTPAAGYAGPDSFTYAISDGTATDTATVEITVGEFGAVSDDFAAGMLDPAWVFQGIAGHAGLGYLGPDAIATITSPEGVKVSASDVLTTPRLTQAVLDLDFQISAGFLSEPSRQFQEHGLLVIEDEANWIRFDLAYTGNRLSLIVGTIENGSTTYPLFETVPAGTVEEFRITRVGDAFTFETRGGGSSDWVQVFSLVRTMDVTEVGVFAGSTSYGTDVPGYTALVDYFESAADPIGIEDGSYVLQNHAPVAVDDSFSGSGAIVLSKADLLANDTDADLDDVLSVTLAGPASHGFAIDNGDGTITYTPDPDFEGTDSFTYILSDGTATDEASVYLDVVPVIEVWYGDIQTFGSPGEGQTWINILGNVSAEVTELSYTLNGGAVRPLSIGPDTRRLQEPGDFNVDIAFAELDGSAADDVVTLVATLANGTTVTRDVTVTYEDGEDWPRNYAIDWSEVADLRDVVQVVDGTWAIGPDGVRPNDLGYDRLLVVGDSGWDNYRLETTVTTHDLENVDPLGRDGGAFAIGMLWGGHTDDPIPDLQPKSGWHPGAAFFYTERLEAHSYHNFFEYLGVNNNVSLEEDRTYNIIVEVHQVGIYDRRYAMKIWEEGTPEPAAWSLDRIETFSLDEAPATGGIYLNAHYYDVSFGDLSVSEITGDDIVSGSDEAEVLIAVTASDPTSGLGEIDVFTGGGGSDTFVLGDASRAYYDDGLAATSGMADYAFVWDFDATEDRVQLHGSAADYALTEDPSGLPPGTAIWRLGGAEPELVGHLHESYGLSLTAGMFSFTDDLIA